MQNTFIMHVENGKSYLSSPLYYSLLLYLPISMRFLLFDYELIKITTSTQLHDNIELHSFSNRLLVSDDVDMLELF